MFTQALTPALFLLLSCRGKDVTSGETAAADITTTGDDSGQDISASGIYEETPKNLIVISIDTYRRDYMARYGGTQDLTPFMDSIAEQSVALDQHTSCSNWTFPSMLCSLSGRSNLETGFMPRLSTATRLQAPANRWSLSGFLKDHGYYTAFFATNSWLSEDWLNDQGYTYQDIPGTGNATVIYEIARDHLLANVDIDRDKWMLHIHVKEPHAAYVPPDEYLDGLDALGDIPWDLTDKDAEYDVAKTHYDELTQEEKDLLLSALLIRYAGEMRYLDDQLAAMWADMDQRGMLDNTLVLFYTDHGEAFWEHGIYTHAYSLFPEENNSVAFFWRKNLVPMAWQGPTSHVDLAPTVLTAMGFDIPDGVTGLPVGSGTDDRVFYYDGVGQWGAVQALRVQNWQLMYRWNTGEKWLFNLDEDPEEQNNVYDPEDPRVIEMWDLLMPMTEQADALVYEYIPIDAGP